MNIHHSDTSGTDIDEFDPPRFFSDVIPQAGRSVMPIALSYFDDGFTPGPKDWLIKGVAARGETISVIGPPGSGKSAFATEISIATAGGWDWRGHRSKLRAGVVYFALERADLVRRRLTAHAQRDGLGGLPIAVAGQIVDGMAKGCVETIIATIRAAEEQFGMSVGLIVLDTFAKLIAAGGGDEDKAKDQGRVLANLRRVQEITGVGIIIIGHTGKDEGRGARGSNAHLGDVDVMIQISGDEYKTASIIKANDAPEGMITRFRLETYSFGQDDDGDEITTAILSRENHDEVSGHEGPWRGMSRPSRVSRGPRLNHSEQRALQLLHDAVLTQGRTPPASEHIPPSIKAAVSEDTWRTYCYEGGISPSGTAEARKKAFQRVGASLLAKCAIGKWGDHIWPVASQGHSGTYGTGVPTCPDRDKRDTGQQPYRGCPDVPSVGPTDERGG